MGDVKELISWGEHGINVVGGPPVSVHECDRRSTDHSDGAGTSVNSCTGSKVNEQLRSQGSLSSRGETVSSRRPVVRATSSARLAWDG